MFKSLFSRATLLATAGLGLVLLLPQSSEAQVRFGVTLGGRYGGISVGNAPYWGGYGRGYGYGYGGLSPYRYGSWGYPGYYSGYNYAYPRYYSGYSYYRPSYTYYPSTSYYQPDYYSYARPSTYTYVNPPGYSYSAAPTTTYQSLYPPSTTYDSTPSSDRAVKVRVTVPDPNAEVYFGGHRTQQTGTVREFASSPLEGDGQYVYQVRARWSENGQMVERSRDVTVRPGEYVSVDFTRNE
jgi:uncharacterized protein (TIGR03000 family)